MADILQEALGAFKSKGGGMSLSLPQFTTQEGMLYGSMILLIVLLGLMLYKFFVYKVRIVVIEDRGRNSLVAQILHGKEVLQNGIPRYQIWGKRDTNRKKLKILASETDNVIPLKMPFGLYRDIVLAHKDKNGDIRPFKTFVHKDQVNINQFAYEDEKTGNKKFKVHEFLDYFYPTLKIDNLKMRGWYVLLTKETFNLYKNTSETMQKAKNLMFVLFIIFAIFIGAKMFHII